MYGINETLLARLYKTTGENFNDSYMNLLPQDNFYMKKWNSEQFPLESIWKKSRKGKKYTPKILKCNIYMAWKWKWQSLSHVQLFAPPWTIVHGILQARILEWEAFPFSWGCSQPRDRTQISNTVGGFFMVYCLCFCPKTLQQTPFIRRIGMARTEDIVRVKK